MTYTLGFDLHRHLLQIKIFVHHKPLIWLISINIRISIKIFIYIIK